MFDELQLSATVENIESFQPVDGGDFRWYIKKKQAKKYYRNITEAEKDLIIETQEKGERSDSLSDKDSGIVEESLDLTISSNKSSFNYDEIQSALKHPTQNAVLNETQATHNSLQSQMEPELEPTEVVEEVVCIEEQQPTNDKVLFYFKHITDRTADLIAGLSFGRGSVPPKGYRLFLQGHQSTQTHTEHFRIEDMKYSPQPIKTTSVLDGRFSDVGFTTDLHFSHDEQKPQISARFEPRTESPTSTTEDETGSSCCSSNYMFTATTSSRPSTKGRGRGRVKSVKGNVSDTYKATTVGNPSSGGLGRGRRNVGSVSEQTFNWTKSPDFTLTLNLDQQSHRHSIPDGLNTPNPMSNYSDEPLTNSFLGPPTHTDSYLTLERSILEPVTHTNSFLPKERPILDPPTHTNSFLPTERSILEPPTHTNSFLPTERSILEPLTHTNCFLLKERPILEPPTHTNSFLPTERSILEPPIHTNSFLPTERPILEPPTHTNSFLPTERPILYPPTHTNSFLPTDRPRLDPPTHANSFLPTERTILDPPTHTNSFLPTDRPRLDPPTHTNSFLPTERSILEPLTHTNSFLPTERTILDPPVHTNSFLPTERPILDPPTHANSFLPTERSILEPPTHTNSFLPTASPILEPPTHTNSFLSTERSILEPPTHTNSFLESNYIEIELPFSNRGVNHTKFVPPRGTRDGYTFKTDTFQQQTARIGPKPTEEYKWNTPIFQNVQHGSLFDRETGYAVTKKTEEIKFDWGKFRKEEGLEEADSSAHVSLELSDSDISSSA